MIDDLILSQKPNEVIEKNHNFNFSLINSKFQCERKSASSASDCTLSQIHSIMLRRNSQNRVFNLYEKAKKNLL